MLAKPQISGSKRRGKGPKRQGQESNTIQKTDVSKDGRLTGKGQRSTVELSSGLISKCQPHDAVHTGKFGEMGSSNYRGSYRQQIQRQTCLHLPMAVLYSSEL